MPTRFVGWVAQPLEKTSAADRSENHTDFIFILSFGCVLSLMPEICFFTPRGEYHEGPVRGGAARQRRSSPATCSV